MNVMESLEPFARDPLAVRLAQLAYPPVPDDLAARVLAAAPTRRPRGLGWRRGLVPVAAVAVGFATIAVTPAGAAISDALRQRFGLVAGAPQVITRPPGACVPTLPPDVQPYDVLTPHCGSGGDTMKVIHVPPTSLADAQAHVGFPIHTPSWLPASVAFVGVRVLPPADDPELVFLAGGRRLTGPGLRIGERQGTGGGGSAVPASAIENVMVNGRPAVYAKGDYEEAVGQGPGGVWTPGADVQELSWEQSGITYDLTASGLRLTREDVIRVAESVG